MLSKVLRALSFPAILLCPVLAFAQSHSVTLSWAPATQSNGITVASWDVLRGAAPGGPYTQIANIPVATTSYTDTSVSSGQVYFYVVHAMDTTGTASADSTEAEAIIPNSAPPLAVATTNLPPAIAGTSYSVTITATGGTAPYTWSGPGVDGLTFSVTGLLSGTPSQAGTFTQSVTVRDSASATASASLALSVTPLVVNQLPSVVSVTPSSGSGLGPQTFNFVYSDPNGFTDLNTLKVQFTPNGANLNSCFIQYIRSANSLYLLNDAGDSFLGPMTLGAVGTLQNSQCSVDVVGSSASGSGNNLTMNLAITFTSSFVGTQTTWMKADDNGGLSSGWQVVGSWTTVPPAFNQLPSIVSVTPSSGNGLGPQTFSFVYSDPSGFAYLNTLKAQFTPNGGNPSSCFLLYVQSANSLYLLDDAGTSWLVPVTLGAAGTLQNSQCSVDVGSSSVSGLGNNLTMNLAITFSSSFAGAQATWMKADDNGGLTSGWQVMGSWLVPPAFNQPPTVVSATPSSGGGAGPQTFSFLYSDLNGFAYLNTLKAQFTPNGGNPNSCFLQYIRSANSLYLLNDAGNGFLGPVTPGTAGTLQNSQCSIDVGSSSVSGSGNNLTMNLAITFSSSFAGTQTTWMKADDNGGLTSSWQVMGSWSVP